MRTSIYSCDWCGQQAPKSDEHPESWMYVSHLGEHSSRIPEQEGVELICDGCKFLRREVIAAVREKRQSIRGVKAEE